MAVSAFNKNSQNLVYQDFFNDLGNLFSNVLESLLSKAVLEVKEILCTVFLCASILRFGAFRAENFGNPPCALRLRSH